MSAPLALRPARPVRTKRMEGLQEFLQDLRKRKGSKGSNVGEQEAAASKQPPSKRRNVAASAPQGDAERDRLTSSSTASTPPSEPAKSLGPLGFRAEPGTDVGCESPRDLEDLSMPSGCLDIYGHGLQDLKPQRPAGQLEVYALPLCKADEPFRKSIEAVLHAAWEGDNEVKLTVSCLLGLQLNGISLRSGRQTGRCQAPEGMTKTGKGGHWLIWERAPGTELTSQRKIVGAMVLRRQQRKGKLCGPVVIDYVCANRPLGGRGFPMLLAAEEICRRESVSVIYSAADLTQDGVRWKSSQGSAADAHRRWGFELSSAEEWKQVGLELYDETRCHVQYMKKQLKS